MEADSLVAALRAELAMSHAEVARLQHALSVRVTSSTEQLQLAQQEILRLQEELSAAADSAASSAAGSPAKLPCNETGEAQSGVHAAAAAAHSHDQQQEEEGSNEGDAAGGRAGGADSPELWDLIVDNPQFDGAHPAPVRAAAAAAAADGVDGGSGGVANSSGPGRDSYSSSGNHEEDMEVSWYQQRVADLEDTIASLQRQLRSQEASLAALQKARGQAQVGGVTG
jgi:hypothetical protein